MIKDAIDSFFAGILAKLGDAWAGLWAPISDNWPLVWSYGTFGLILLGAIGLGIVVRLFLPSDWAKFPLLTIFVGLLAAVGWLVGSVSMHTKMKAKLDAERARKTRNLPPPKPKPPADDGRWRPFG